MLKSMIDSSPCYQKGGSKKAAVTSHVGVMTPEMHEVFKTLWNGSKAKTTNIVIGQPKKKIVKPRKSKKCASANV